MENRVIKFRAWSVKEKRFLEDYEFTITNDGIPLDEYGDESKNNSCPSGEYKIMQFTGLLDKNGKEIYEGDKVIYTLTHDSDSLKIEATVEWHNHAWRLNRIWLLTEIRTIEIIGNVFSTPDLLTPIK